MEKRKLVLSSIVLLSALILLAFLYLPSEEDTLEDSRSIANQSSYQVNYSVYFNESLVNGYNYSRFEVYSSSDQYKNVIRSNTGYRNESFLTGEDSLRCVYVEESINQSKCSIGESQTRFFYSLMDIGISYNSITGKVKEVPEGKCRVFNFSVGNHQVPGGENVLYSPDVSLCADTEEGYIHEMVVTGQIDDINGTPKTVKMIEITAESINEEYDNDVTPDMRIMVDAVCNVPEPHLDILLLDRSGEVTIDFGEVNETVSLKRYRPFEAFVPSRLLEEGENSLTVYSGSYSKTAYCTR